MALGETARLLASLDLHDGLTPVVKTMSGSLDKLDARIGKSHNAIARAGAGVGSAVKAGAVVAVGALTGLAALSVELAHEGQAAQNGQIKYAQAIANSGKVSADYVTKLNAQQKALENLGGVDDEAIKAAQTQLIQMGLTGDQVERLTGLSLGLSKATGKDLSDSTLAVGKAFQGNNRALLQLGIVVPKGADAIAILNQRFGGTTKALSGQLDTRLAVLHERLADVREEAGVKLLPAMTKIVDVVGQRLVPAFGTFIDTILPSVLSGLDKLSGFLESGGAEAGIGKFLDIAKTAAPIIKQAAEDTLTVIQTAASLFQSLPPEIQALAVAGLTINKLTGGLVTNLAGGLISAVISSFKGLMNVNAAVVNVNGGVVNGGLPGAVAGAGAAGIGVGLLGASTAIGASVAATVIGSASVRGAVDQAITRADVSALTAQAEAARKHGVSDSNNAALKALQEIAHNTASLAAPTTATQSAQDSSEKAQQARNTAFNSNPTRADLRHQIAEDKRNLDGATGKNAVTIGRHLQSLQNRLDNRIATSNARVADAMAEAKRAIVTAIALSAPVINVPVTTQTLIDGRLVSANFSRYTSVIGGKVVNGTSGSGV